MGRSEPRILTSQIPTGVRKACRGSREDPLNRIGETLGRRIGDSTASIRHDFLACTHRGHYYRRTASECLDNAQAESLICAWRDTDRGSRQLLGDPSPVPHVANKQHVKAGCSVFKFFAHRPIADEYSANWLSAFGEHATGIDQQLWILLW